MQRAFDDIDPDPLVVVLGCQPVERLGGVEQSDATARHYPLLDRRPRRVRRVVDPVLSLLHFDLGRPADADHRNPAGQLGQPLLQLFAVVVGGRLLDLRLDLHNAALDVLLFAGTVDDRRVFLLDPDALGSAQHVESDVFELDAEIFTDHLAAGQDRHVLQHCLAAVAKAGRLDRGNFQAAPQFVDDQRRQRLTFDVFGDDQQRLAGLNDRFEQWQQRLQARQFLLVEQDVRVVELGDHLFGVGHEIGANITTVELHALDHVELGFERFRLFDRDDSLVPDLLHRFGDHPADLAVVIGGYRSDLLDFVVCRNLLGAFFDILDDGIHSLVDTALQIHRVHPGGDRLGAFAHDRMSEHGRGRRAVAGQIARL